MKTINIGRGNDCEIIITNDKISRHHAKISILNGQYLYHDVSKNGSNIGGQIIMNQKILIAPGTSILLANKVSLPWGEVYRLLPIKGQRFNIEETNIQTTNTDVPKVMQPIQIKMADELKDELGFGWGILAFVIPLAGWIMYFFWKDKTPNKANGAGLIGTISFIINIITIFA